MDVYAPPPHAMPTSRTPLLIPASREEAPRGRPTSQRAHQLRTVIIEKASELMLEHGFDNISLDVIAAAAGVTKRTIYTRFASKEMLLQAVLAHATLPAYQIASRIDPHLGLRDGLIALATALHDTLMTPQMQHWLRFAVTGMARRPELDTLIRGTIDDYLAFIERLLGQALQAQQLYLTDMQLITKMFASLVSAPAQNLAYFSIDPGSPQQQAHYLCHAVDMLLRGCIKPA